MQSIIRRILLSGIDDDPPVSPSISKGDDYKFECDVCGARFVWISSLKRHERIHNSSPRPSDSLNELELESWPSIAKTCHAQFLVDEEPSMGTVGSMLQDHAKQRAG